MGLGGIGAVGRKGESCSPGGLGVAGPRICGDCGPRRSGVWGLLLSKPGTMSLEVMATSPTSAPGSKLGEPGPAPQVRTTLNSSLWAYLQCLVV